MKSGLLLLLLLLFTRNIFAQTEIEERAEKIDTEQAENTPKHGLMAINETLLSNGAVLFFNTFITDTAWAVPTSDSVRHNFTQRWEWEETDNYLVNQIGHPYQGSFYFNAGRINGFNFYESSFFSILGSFTWEAFCEENYASMNDLISTTIGSMPIGEMLYRLYAEAYYAGIPGFLMFFINPMAGFHRLVTGWEPPPEDRNLYSLRTYIGAAYTCTEYKASASNGNLFEYNGAFADIGVNIVYGDPFEQHTTIPYKQFELTVSMGMNPGSFNDVRVISDGYLFSFSPLQAEKNKMSTGLSLHLDFVSLGKFGLLDSTIDQCSYALDWTVKYQYMFSEETNLQVKYHAGFTFLGASEYYSPESGKEKVELKNYGYGFNAKRYYRFEHGKRGALEYSRFFYSMWTYPDTSALSYGNVTWHFRDFTYSYLVTKHISLGFTDSYASERGTFDGYPNTKKKSRSLKLFVAWNL